MRRTRRKRAGVFSAIILESLSLLAIVAVAQPRIILPLIESLSVGRTANRSTPPLHQTVQDSQAGSNEIAEQPQRGLARSPSQPSSTIKEHETAWDGYATRDVELPWDSVMRSAPGVRRRLPHQNVPIYPP